MTLFIIGSWALWAFFGKIASQKIGLQVAFWTYLIGPIFIFLYLFFSRKLLPLKLDQNGVIFAILSGIAIAIGSILYYILLEKKPAGVLLMTTSLYPIITLLLSAYFLKESITVAKGVGMIFAIIALILLNL